MLCGIDLYKLLNYKSNDKYLTIVYSIFIIVFIKIMQKKVFRKGRCDMVPVIDNIETGNNIRRIMQNQD